MSPAEEVLARREARKGLAAWMRYRKSVFKPALHHQLMIAELEKIESGENNRLMLLLPPGSAKSTYGSVEFPTWYMGRHPENSVIAASNTTDLAERFSRRVRNLCSEKNFRDVFGCGVSEDYAGAGKWETDRGGEYYAAGVGAAIAGRRADLAIIDDPTKSREDADSERSRIKQWEWYVNDLLTRLKPDASIILIMCMVGDTPVLMADGSERPLKDLRVGDYVATYVDGRLSLSKVMNWANQGVDRVYEIRMKSGAIVKANERHPFLIYRGGCNEWIRLKNLMPGDRILRAVGQLDTAKLKKSCSTPLDTYTIVPDEIVEILLSGQEEVFDIQVAGTENFIANGLVSHNTRWHEDDLGGRILERERDRWKVIKIPMEAEEEDPLGREPGERLWKEWYTEEMLELAKQDTRSWWALYQQNPHSEEGDYFKADWFHDYSEPPKGLKIYGASDYAVTDGTGDYTEHGICGVDASGNMYILDWWRAQKSADVWIDKMADLIEKWQPVCWFGEAGPIRRSVEPFMMKRLSERGAFCRIEWLTSIHDKEARARGIQAFMAMGKMFWPKFAGWKSDVQGQMLKFPAGKHDDAVDVISLFGRGLKFINSSRKPVRRLIIEPLRDWMAG